MKRAENSAAASGKLDLLISNVSENEILNMQSLRSIRGGDGEGNSGEPIIIIPDPTQT